MKNEIQKWLQELKSFLNGRFRLGFSNEINDDQNFPIPFAYWIPHFLYKHRASNECLLLVTKLNKRHVLISAAYQNKERLEVEETLKYRCVYRPPCGKVEYSKNDHGRTQNYDFSVLDRKYLFWASLVQKSKLSI